MPANLKITTEDGKWFECAFYVPFHPNLLLASPPLKPKKSKRAIDFAHAIQIPQMMIHIILRVQTKLKQMAIDLFNHS
jgi:hypothetical protein